MDNKTLLWLLGAIVASFSFLIAMIGIGYAVWYFEKRSRANAATMVKLAAALESLGPALTKLSGFQGTEDEFVNRLSGGLMKIGERQITEISALTKVVGRFADLVAREPEPESALQLHDDQEASREYEKQIHMIGGMTEAQAEEHLTIEDQKKILYAPSLT